MEWITGSLPISQLKRNNKSLLETPIYTTTNLDMFSHISPFNLSTTKSERIPPKNSMHIFWATMQTSIINLKFLNQQKMMLSFNSNANRQWWFRSLCSQRIVQRHLFCFEALASCLSVKESHIILVRGYRYLAIVDIASLRI